MMLILLINVDKYLFIGLPVIGHIKYVHSGSLHPMAVHVSLQKLKNDHLMYHVDYSVQREEQFQQKILLHFCV